jgi:FkbM family methyltransferase
LRANSVFLPHAGWFIHETGDAVARFLDEGWYEYREQAFVWLYARPDDVFIDCGAHFGLYAVTYSVAARAGASVWAIEPNPSTRVILRRNLRLHGMTSARILPWAVGDCDGDVEFYSSGPTKAAYSGLHLPEPGASATRVRLISLDQLCSECGIDSVSFLKLDIEGAEIAALQGARESIAAGRLSVLMVEFTEQNLLRSGRTTKDLFAELESLGYRVCRFDEERLQLEPVRYTGPVWYDNYFAVADLQWVNCRLRQATISARRVAHDILRRGRIAQERQDSVRRASDAERRVEVIMTQLQEAYARSGEANWRADEANKRADHAVKLLEEAYARSGETNWRAEEANKRADHAIKLLEEAYARSGEANWQAEEANKRADHAIKLLEEAYVRTGEANWRAEEANRRADHAVKLLEEAYTRTGEANWRAEEANKRAGQAAKLLEEAYAHSGEVNWRAEEANKRADQSVKLLEEAYAYNDEANQRAEEARLHIESLRAELEKKEALVGELRTSLTEQRAWIERLLATPYVFVGRKLRLLPDAIQWRIPAEHL